LTQPSNILNTFRARQLDFPQSEIQIPHPSLTVTKRSGEIEPFNTLKIAEAIHKAAVQSESEGFEWAANLASGIALYLDSTSTEFVPTEDIHNSAERVLLEMGHIRTALSLTRYRKRRQRLTALDEGARQGYLHPDHASEEVSISKSYIHDFIMGKHSGVSENPSQSDAELGRFLKQSYLLSTLLPADLLQAHHASQLKIKGLEGPDRLAWIRFTIERLKKFGCKGLDHEGFPIPRKYEELSFQFSFQLENLASFVNDGLEISGLNYSFAPYVLEFDTPAMEEVARCILDALATIRSTHAMPKICLDIQLQLPQEFSGMEAIGPNGASTGKTYQEYQDTARALSVALLSIASQNERYAPFSWKADLDPDPTWMEILSEGINSGLSIQLSTPPEFPFLPNTLAPWPFQETVINQIQLQLPTIAQSEEIFEVLDRTLDLAVQGHVKKYQFIKEILDQSRTTALSALKYQHHGEAWLNLEQGIYSIQISGLNECIERLFGQPIHESEEGHFWSLRLIQHLVDGCARHSEATGLHLRLETIRGDLPNSPGVGFTHKTNISLADRLSGEKQVRQIMGTQTVSYLPDFHRDGLSLLMKSTSPGRFQFVR
jgi:ribonucleoside-triphosphate reductase